MIYAVLGLVLLLILILIAVRLAMGREAPSPRLQDSSTLMASGVYSITRRSPRDAVARREPSEPAMRQYLKGINEDIGGNALSETDKECLVESFLADREKNVCEIEQGDAEGVDFYYYEYQHSDPVCEHIITKGSFVNREEIYRHPELLPPFHLGCGCRLRRQRGTDTVRKTIALHFHPLLRDNVSFPSFPSWHEVIRIT